MQTNSNNFKPELSRIMKDLGSKMLPEQKEKIGYEL